MKIYYLDANGMIQTTELDTYLKLNLDTKSQKFAWTDPQDALKWRNQYLVEETLWNPVLKFASNWGRFNISLPVVRAQDKEQAQMFAQNFFKHALQKYLTEKEIQSYSVEWVIEVTEAKLQVKIPVFAGQQN